MLLFNVKEEPEFAKAPHGCCHLLFICQGIRDIPLRPQPPNLVSLNFSSFLPGSATITQTKAFKSVKRCQLLLPSFDTLLPASNLSDTSSISHNLTSPPSLSFFLECLSSPLPNSLETFRSEFKVSALGPFNHLVPCIVRVLAADSTLLYLKIYLHFLGHFNQGHWSRDGVIRLFLLFYVILIFHLSFSQPFFRGFEAIFPRRETS